MSSFLGILVWCCALIIASSANQVLGEETTDTSLRNPDGGMVRPVRGAKRPSCSISIPEDDGDGLTKLLNGVLNVFTARSQTTVVNASLDASSSFVLDCKDRISGLEPSIWRILNRVWLATSCQYSEEEFDEALREVENQADKVLITLKNVDMVPFNDTVKIDYYSSTVATIRTTLIQDVEKMKEAQNSGRCHSSAVKQLTVNFEEALRETKAQKETIALLRGETREVRAAVSLQNEEMKKVLDAMRIQKDETESALRKMELQDEAMDGALEMIRSQIRRTDNALAEVAAQTNSTTTALQAVESQKKQFEELRSIFDNRTLKTEDAFSAVESAGERFTKEIEELRMKNRAVEETLEMRGSEFVEYKRNIREDVESQRKEVEELRSVFHNQTLQTEKAFSTVESAGRHFTKEIEELRTKTTVVQETLLKRESELAEFKANISGIVTHKAVKNSEQDGILEKLKLFPATAMQAYIFWGLAGLTGKPLNIGNEHYKGEFLYLARIPTDRNVNVFWDGGTLAVGGEKLRESAFQWVFVRIPGEDSSVVYIRNKLNELKPISSKQDDSSSLRNYILIETVSSPTIGESSQLVITMKETVQNKYYYLPRSTPNTNSALNGRDIDRASSPSRPGTKWIVNLAS